MKKARKPEVPSQAKTRQDAAPAESRESRLIARLKRLRGPIAAIAAVGAVLGGFVGYWNAYRTVRDGVAPVVVTSNLPADAGPLSVVVLPFTNQTGDTQKAYIAEGLTSSITADLSRVRD